MSVSLSLFLTIFKYFEVAQTTNNLTGKPNRMF